MTKVDFPDERANRSPRDVFMLYRNRQTLHENPNAVEMGAECFDDMMRKFGYEDSQIQKDMGWKSNLDLIYIEGKKASEYVKKYSPENADDKNYVKAQVMAAITSGRHHVDMVQIRTDSTGHFKTSATELSMDLSAMKGEERLMEKSRQSRAVSLMESEKTRLKRQSVIEAEVLGEANAAAEVKLKDRASEIHMGGHQAPGGGHGDIIREPAVLPELKGPKPEKKPEKQPPKKPEVKNLKNMFEPKEPQKKKGKK